MSLFKRLWDWKQPYLEIAILAIIAILINPEWIKEQLEGFFSKSPSINDYIFFPLLFLDGWLFRLVVIVLVDIFVIKTINKGSTLNRGNIYHDHFYFAYIFCARILGYKKCNLRLTPIPMQFKLVINDTFDEFVYNDGVQEGPESELITKRTENNTDITKRVNLVLADSYPIAKGQLPANVLIYTTFYIERSENINQRSSSKKYVAEVMRTVHELPDVVTEINIFSTLNPTNCYNIAKGVFGTGDRDSIKHLWVYQQEKDNPRAFSKAKKIY